MDVMDKYFAKYDNTNNTRPCDGLISNSNITVDGKLKSPDEKACRFILQKFKSAGCMKETHYGFKDGTPCVIVSLNRLIGWKPESYAAGQVPSEVSARYKPGSIAFDCGGTVSSFHWNSNFSFSFSARD
jgi:sodium/potassium-transporting ATPase subunit beta